MTASRGNAPTAATRRWRRLYGYPHVTEALQEQLDAGQVVLGGCVIEPGAPRWTCTRCGWCNATRDVKADDVEG